MSEYTTYIDGFIPLTLTSEDLQPTDNDAHLTNAHLAAMETARRFSLNRKAKATVVMPEDEPLKLRLEPVAWGHVVSPIEEYSYEA